MTTTEQQQIRLKCLELAKGSNILSYKDQMLKVA